MLPNFKFADDLARQFIQPKPCHYFNQQIWKHITEKEKYAYQNNDMNLIGDRCINLHLIRQKRVLKERKNIIDKEIDINNKHQQYSQPEICIIYLHGLASYCVEGCFLIDNLKYFDALNCSVCLFDMRGHGKDKAKDITFSMKESIQLFEIISYLQKQKNINQFILWGRSMGATTILKMLTDFEAKILEKNIEIRYLILDSPFQSFQKASAELLSKQTGLPQLFSKGILEYLMGNLERNAGFKISVEIDKLPLLKCPITFLYSQDDNVISSAHTKSLFEKYSHPQKQKIDVQVGHNDKRPDTILNSLFHKISYQLKQNLRKAENKRPVSTKKNGLKVTKFNKIMTLESEIQDDMIAEDLTYQPPRNSQKIFSPKFQPFKSQILQKSNSNLIRRNNVDGYKSNKGINIHQQSPKVSFSTSNIIVPNKKVEKPKSSKKLELSYKFIQDQKENDIQSINKNKHMRNQKQKSSIQNFSYEFKDYKSVVLGSKTETKASFNPRLKQRYQMKFKEINSYKYQENIQTKYSVFQKEKQNIKVLANLQSYSSQILKPRPQSNYHLENNFIITTPPTAPNSGRKRTVSILQEQQQDLLLQKKPPPIISIHKMKNINKINTKKQINIGGYPKGASKIRQTIQQQLERNAEKYRLNNRHYI